jgi:hypothetical protein
MTRSFPGQVTTVRLYEGFFFFFFFLFRISETVTYCTTHHIEVKNKQCRIENHLFHSEDVFIIVLIKFALLYNRLILSYSQSTKILELTLGAQTLHNLLSSLYTMSSST